MCFLAGVIDADYRGELKILLYNLSEVPFEIKKGDRIAQLICERISYPQVVQCFDIDFLTKTQRGSGGFGSTD